MSLKGLRRNHHNNRRDSKDCIRPLTAWRAVAVQKSSFAGMQRPIAHTLDKTDKWWSMLILRDAIKGISRLGDLQKSLAIPPSSLAKRLEGLVEKDFSRFVNTAHDRFATSTRSPAADGNFSR